MLKHFLAAAAPFIFFASIAQAQVSLSPVPLLHFVDNNGQTLQGGKLFIYSAGTTTKITTYTNSTGFTPNTNPIILNARGEAQVWLSPGQNYKFVLASATDSDPPTNPIWTVDHISNSPTGGVIDARAMGANDNGSTDAAPAINNALQLAQATGGCAFLGKPRIAYLVKSAGIYVPQNGCLEEAPGSPAGLMLGSGQTFNLVTLGSGAVVSDVVADGNGGTVSDFEMGNATNPQVRNVVARGAAGGTGVDFGSSTNGKMVGGLIYGNDEGTGGYLATEAVIDGVTAYGNAAHDLGFNTCSHCMILNSFVNSAGTGATNVITAYATDNTDLLIANNTVVTTGMLDCIRAAGTNVSVVNNVCNGGGIYIGGATPYTTGTVSVATGSRVVNGIGTDFTAPGYFLSGGAGSTFFTGPDSQQYTVLQIDSSSQLHLATPYAGATTTGTYQLYGSVPVVGAVVTNNTISNSIYSIITVVHTVGATISDNNATVNNNTDNGLYIVGSDRINIANDNVVNSGRYGLFFSPDIDYSTGNASASNGDATVTAGGGAVWTGIPDNGTAWFQIAGSGNAPQQIVGVASDGSSLTLAQGYVGTNCPSCAYRIALSLNTSNTVSGGSYQGANIGMFIADTVNSMFSGFNILGNPVSATVQEGGNVHGNYYRACMAPDPTSVPYDTLSCDP